MKKLLLLSYIIASANCFAQNLTSYKAINGLIYKIGDTVKLGRGSAPNGSFNYMETGGFGAFLAHRQQRGDQLSIDKTYANTPAIIKKIKASQINGKQKTTFMVYSRGPANFNLTIDEAIQACEVLPCSSQPANGVNSVADEILKLKKLLDSGAITQTEYDAQKKKLMGM